MARGTVLQGYAMRHVFVCTTEYSDHWAKTLAKKRAQAAAMSEAERQRIRDAVPEAHADGHRGRHCGETMGGGIYEMFQERLRAAGIADVIVSPNACTAQHAWGCIVMVYPDGIWYRVQEMADAEKILVQHLIGGKPVAELMHRRLRPPAGGLLTERDEQPAQSGDVATTAPGTARA
jgi:(2Fe-2S) ferredoxin